jgi:SAM-dependent methyltransferase
MNARRHLDYAGFARLAGDSSLSKYERIGFPDSYRAGYEDAIFADIRAKLPRLSELGLSVLDIGPGCSDLPAMLIELSRAQGHRLHLVDSPEMLSLLPEESFICKRPGQFPKDCETVADLVGRVDVMLCYSVLHYVFVDANPFDFIDRAIQLLAPGGELLIGDIPNVSKRRRFFASEAGVAFHRSFTGTDTAPEVQFNEPVPTLIDDSVVLGLVSRARAAGADAYILPQPPGLPMSNRREDILVRKP